MAVVLMSKAELSRVDTLARVQRGELPVAGAASILGLSPRQVFRLLRRFRAEGASGLASRRRGRPSNRRLPASVREAALAAVRERYADFGPTLAAEKLAASHDIRLSRETLRQWMAEAGLWVSRKARRGRVHQPRHRIALRRRARRLLPRESPPEALAGPHLRRLADRLNDTPRRCLGYRTPREVFREHPAAQTGPPPAYGSLRHRFAVRRLRGGGGWTRRPGWARARRSAPHTLAETGPRPPAGGGSRRGGSGKRWSACCGARTSSWCPAGWG